MGKGWAPSISVSLSWRRSNGQQIELTPEQVAAIEKANLADVVRQGGAREESFYPALGDMLKEMADGTERVLCQRGTGRPQRYGALQIRPVDVAKRTDDLKALDVP